MNLRIPKLKTYHIILLSISVLLIIACLIATVICYPSLPDRIPMHFAADGSVDQYGGKGSAFLIPIISLVIFAILVFMLFVPRVLENPNTLRPLDVRFRPQVVQLSTRLMVEVAFLCVAFMTYIQTFTLIQKPLNPVGAWMIAAALVIDSLIHTIKLSTFTVK